MGAMQGRLAWNLPIPTRFPKFVPGNRPIPPSLPTTATENWGCLSDFCPFTKGFSHGNRGLQRTPQGLS